MNFYWQFLQGVGIGLVLLAIFLLTYKTWTLGVEEKDFHIICLGNHQYYRANFSVKGMVAIRLNNDGKPVRCVKDMISD